MSFFDVERQSASRARAADAASREEPGFAPPVAAAEPLAPASDARLVAPEITAGEQVMRSAYRLGVPASLLVNPFRRPTRLRIQATVESPLAGDRVAGMALRAGHFLIGGARVPIGQADFSPSAKLPPLVETTLHGFTWLRDLAASSPEPQCATAEPILRAWLAANGFGRPDDEREAHKGAAWSVENAARRLMAWLVHAPLVLGGTDKAVRNAVLEAIGETARWLDRRAGKAEDRQGEALAWAAITAAGLLLPEGKPRRLYGEAGLVDALANMVGEEGGVFSRSPLVQAEAIAMLVDLAACYRATRREPPEAIAAMLNMLVPPLLTLANSDGGLGNWQGAGAVAAERVEALVAATGVRTRPLGPEARQWGYQRIVADGSVLVADAAPPPLERDARSGCASTLAFEFSAGGELIVVNCGGAALAGGLVPARIEQGLRATAAHSTLSLGDANSTAVAIGGKLGKGVNSVEVDRAAAMLPGGAHMIDRPATRLDMAHDGYVSRLGLTHRRILTLSEDGQMLAGEDRLEPAGRKGRRGKLGYAVRFHLGPHVDLRLAGDGHAADLLLPDGSFWRFQADGECITAEESIWVDGEGRPHETQQMVIEGMASRQGSAFSWSFRRMG